MRDPIERLAWLLDSAFQIPGTRWRFGLDALIGLIPGLGEWVMLFAQSALVLWAVGRYDLPAILATRMVLNVAIDSLFGSIPLVGDLFDFVFKANTRNVELLRAYHRQSRSEPVSLWRHYAFFAAVLGSLMALMAFTVWASIRVILMLYEGIAPYL